MPAFTFEKISPPVRRGPIAPIVKKQRGVIVQILDRFVEARVKRTRREEKGVIARNLETPIAEMGLAIKVETRTGDTPVSRRQRQRRYPPDSRSARG